MKKFMVYGISFIALIIFTIYYLPYTNSTHAQSPVPIREHFGFGDIQSLGEGTSKLVAPAFSIATVIVIMYFLFGAFNYLKAGGNKEEMEGARQMIEHAIVGFVILMLAFLMLQFLLSSLFKTTDFQIIK